MLVSYGILLVYAPPVVSCNRTGSLFAFYRSCSKMIIAKPRSVERKNSSTDENITFWQNSVEGELVDVDLFTACANGEYEYVESFIHKAKSDADIVNKSNRSGWTPLLYSCYVGNEKITELLIHKGGDVLFEENKHGCTPIMFAASSGNISLVKRLVEVSLTNKQKTTQILDISTYIVFFFLFKTKFVFLNSKFVKFTEYTRWVPKSASYQGQGFSYNFTNVY